jgi:hypothetical protein
MALRSVEAPHNRDGDEAQDGDQSIRECGLAIDGVSIGEIRNYIERGSRRDDHEYRETCRPAHVERIAREITIQRMILQ